MISAALAAGSATVVRGEAQVMRTKPYWFIVESARPVFRRARIDARRDGVGTAG